MPFCTRQRIARGTLSFSASIFRACRSPTLNPVADLLQKAMEAGYLKQDDVWEVAMELWTHTHGYVALYRGGRFDLPEKEFRALVRRSIRRMIHGLKA